jgi:hypothetical protein
MHTAPASRGPQFASLAGAAFLLFSNGVAAAGPYRIDIVAEPTYTFCVSGASCPPAVRNSLALEYKPLVTPKANLRVRLARSYARSTQDDVVDDIDATQERYSPAVDSLELRLRIFDGDGFQRQEIKSGYAYQYPSAGANSHHTLFASDDVFFGRSIRRGTDSAAHQFDAGLKLSKDSNDSAGVLPQTFVQAKGNVTFPLEPNGMWRAEAGYTVQQQLGGTGLSPLSMRLSATVTHDFSSAVRAYARLDARASGATAAVGTVPRKTTGQVGVKLTF